VRALRTSRYSTDPLRVDPRIAGNTTIGPFLAAIASVEGMRGVPSIGYFKKRAWYNEPVTAQKSGKLSPKMRINSATLSEYFTQGCRLPPVHQGQSIGS